MSEDWKLTQNWSKVENADGYDVYVYMTGMGDYINLGSVKSNKAKLSGLNTGETYIVKVIAYKKVAGEKVYGEFSAPITFKGK